MSIDFKVMGLDSSTSDYLNWCMQNRDNLEYQKECNVFEIKPGSATLYFDDLGAIVRIDPTPVHRRNVIHISKVIKPI